MSKPNQAIERLSLEEVSRQIKGLISKSAFTKIEVGELLIEYKEDIEYGDTERFYKVSVCFQE